MSKSKGNVVPPDVLVNRYGTDTVRAFLMFLGPFDRGGDWNDGTEQQVGGIARFLSRVWSVTADTLVYDKGGSIDAKTEADIRRLQHKAIGRVLEDMENWQFNTGLSGLMEYNNALIKLAGDIPAVQASPVWHEALETLLKLLAPLAPHITEELWHLLGNQTTIHDQAMPVYDAALAADQSVTLIVQINGKLREKLEVPAGISEAEARQQVMSAPKIAAALEGVTPKKVIYVEGKLINFVI
jgi:leucyl-tRNA synthetase